MSRVLEQHAAACPCPRGLPGLVIAGCATTMARMAFSCALGGKAQRQRVPGVLVTAGWRAGAAGRCAGTGRPRLLVAILRAGGHRRGSSSAIAAAGGWTP